MKNLKRLIALTVYCLWLMSCSTEYESDNGISAITENRESKYCIQWDSNQINPYLKISVIRRGEYIIKDYVSYEKEYNIDLRKGDVIIIYIGLTDVIVDNPECYLSISKFLCSKSDCYTPDNLELMYELESDSNGLYFSGYVNKDGEITD